MKLKIYFDSLNTYIFFYKIEYFYYFIFLCPLNDATWHHFNIKNIEEFFRFENLNWEPDKKFRLSSNFLYVDIYKIKKIETNPKKNKKKIKLNQTFRAGSVMPAAICPSYKQTKWNCSLLSNGSSRLCTLSSEGPTYPLSRVNWFIRVVELFKPPLLCCLIQPLSIVCSTCYFTLPKLLYRKDKTKMTGHNSWWKTPNKGK